jgi:HD superfamily phosphohydrolase
VILDPESDVHQVLISHSRDLPQRIIGFMTAQPRRTVFCDILSSQLDADRLDYLLRDNLMTGSGYGGYDLRWLMHALTIDEPSERLVVTWKGVSAVEAYLQARYHMYRNVYFHKVVRSGEGMVKLALQRARRLAVQGRLEWPQSESPVFKALVGQKLTTEEFIDMDDVSVMQCFKIWTRGDDATLASLCRGLLDRRLFKTIDLSRLRDAQAARLIAQDVAGAIASAGGEPAYEMFYDEPADTPYEMYTPSDTEAKSEIMVREPDGKLVELSTISPLPAALNQELSFRRLHVSGEWREIAEKIVRESRGKS